MTSPGQQSWLEQRVAATPDAEAIRWVSVADPAEVDVWTWRDLYERASKTAQALELLHGPNLRRILSFYSDVRNSVVLLHACWMRSIAPIMASFSWTPEERQRAIHDSGCDLWLYENDDANVVMTRAQPAWTGDSENPAALGVFTSGTTGSPRLAELSRGALEASAHASAAVLGTTAHDRWLAAMPMTHVGGISILVRSVLQGFCVVMDPWRDARRLVQVAHAQRVSVLSVVPTMLHRVVGLGEDGRAPSSIRATLVGGAAALSRDVETAAALGWAPRLTYGLTEAASQVATSSALVTAPTTCGAAVPGVNIHIRHPGPDGVGEIVVSGATLFDGYRRPDGTLDRPPTDGFATGDLGRMDPDGLRVFVRRTDLIVTGGENVYPAEVEAALASLPGVAECAVVGVPDDEWGQRVEALVVPLEGQTLDTGTLRALLALRIARFKLPRRIVLCDALPRTSSGKVIRSGLQQMLADTGNET